MFQSCMRFQMFLLFGFVGTELTLKLRFFPTFVFLVPPKVVFVLVRPRAYFTGEPQTGLQPVDHWNIHAKRFQIILSYNFNNIILYCRIIHYIILQPLELFHKIGSFSNWKKSCNCHWNRKNMHGGGIIVFTQVLILIWVWNNVKKK